MKNTITITAPDPLASLSLPSGMVRNPYPAWQDTGTNCWNCYRILMNADEYKLHLCGACQSRGIITTDAAIVCPRCKRVVDPWPLKRGDRCSMKDWGVCIRQYADVLADLKTRREKQLARNEETRRRNKAKYAALAKQPKKFTITTQRMDGMQ